MHESVAGLKAVGKNALGHNPDHQEDVSLFRMLLRCVIAGTRECRGRVLLKSVRP